MNLRIPGPVPMPHEIRCALEQELIDHRGPEFVALQARVVAALKRVFQTQNDVIVFTSSGTGGLEAAIANTLSPGDLVLSFSAGAFGDRFADIAAAYAAQVVRTSIEWGGAIEPERVTQILKQHTRARAVLITHNETSTGVLHPLKEVAQVVRDHSDATLIVDGVSSLGATELLTDAWRVDIVGTASQKAWACPPGVSMLSVSPRAWRTSENARSPRFYFDLREMKKTMQQGMTPFTPATLTYYALDRSLELIEAEGVEQVWARHARIAQYTRERAQNIGLKLFSDARYASPSVTALRAPDGIDAEELRRVAREDSGLVLGGGLGMLKGKVFRIGHMGWVTEREIDDAISAITSAMKKFQG